MASITYTVHIFAGSDKRCVVALYDVTQFLLVSTLLYVWGHQEERFLGNVDSSFCYHYLVGFIVDVQLGSSRDLSSCDTRLRRYFLRIGENDEVHQVATYLRHVIRNLYYNLDFYETGCISILVPLQVCAIFLADFTFEVFVCLKSLHFLLHSTCIGAKKIVPMFPAYYIFNSLLLMLLLLHIIWTYFILKVLYRAILSGQVLKSHSFPLSLVDTKPIFAPASQMEKDSRSSSSEYFSEDNSKSGNSSASPTTPSKRLPTSTSHSREHKNSK